MKKTAEFQFLPLNFSWVALHPQPVGVINFIGGAFFGTFPTLFYRYLLEHLFYQGYTIIAIPYRFTFRHWSVAISLVGDRGTLREILISEAKHRQYDYTIYQDDLESGESNYFWLGHSLGCKYISLLELMTDLERSNCHNLDLIRLSFGNCIPSEEQRHLEAALAQVNLNSISLKNQKSILMAPAIEGLEGAIPFLRNPRFAGLKKFLNRVGIKVEPSQEETFCLIEQSQLFNLTSLISFQGDTRVAAATVQWLLDNLEQRLLQIRELRGKHLAPLGWLNGDPEIVKTLGEFLKPTFRR